MTPLRIGLIGCGWVGTSRHLPAYLAHEDAEVVAVYDHTLGRSEVAAKKAKGAIAARDLNEFFGQDLDAISVCTSPWSHAELTVDALQRGVHVLTEKPMAMNSAEAQSMADAAAAANKVLCVAHNFRFARSITQADALLERFGPVQYALGTQLSSFNRRLPRWYRELPGGLMFDELPHMLYTMQHFLGPIGLDDVRVVWNGDRSHLATCEIRLRGPNATGQVLTVFDSPVSEWHLSLIGTSGVADADMFREFATGVASDGGHEARDILRTSARALGGHVAGFATSGVKLAQRRLTWGHGPLITAFIEALRDGTAPPVSTEDALGIVRLTDGVVAALG